MAKVENGVIKKVIGGKKREWISQPCCHCQRRVLRRTLQIIFMKKTIIAKGDKVNNKEVKKTGKDKRYSRFWRCTNVRETIGGRLEQCGHTQVGLYPPEKCPGEMPKDLDKLNEERTPEVVSAWQAAHMKDPRYFSEATFFPPRPDDMKKSLSFDIEVDNNETHMEMGFKSRLCSGTKINFKLLNDPYRWPYEAWEPFDAEIIPFVENGEITSFEVVKGGAMYLSTQIALWELVGRYYTIVWRRW